MTALPRSKEGHGGFLIPSLDGLRTASFLLVFLGHSGMPFIPGGFGVTVFFFLSGFLITTLLRLEATKTGRIDFKSFYLRRVLRIWPPFYLVLFTGMLLVAVGQSPGQLEGASVLAQCLHYSNYWIVSHGWGGIPIGTGVYWSLAVEEHFYLVFPAFYALLLRSGFSPRSQQRAFFAACAAVLAWRLTLVFFFHSLDVGVDRTYIATDARLDSMLFGCALAVYGNPKLDLPKQDAPRAVDLAAFAGGVALLLVSFGFRNEAFRQTFRYTIQGIGLYPIFVTAVRFPEWGPFRLLNTRPVKFMGTLTYSLYLIHQAVIITVESKIDHRPAILMPLSFVISFVLATLVWRFVEEPCAAIRRRLAARVSPAVVPAA